MRLTIGFDATAAARQSAGIGRYTRELLRALPGAAPNDRFRVFYCAGGASAGELPHTPANVSMRALPLSDRVMNAVWHRLRLPLPVQLVTGGFDLFHSPDFTIPPVMRRPTVLTVHDLAFRVVPECAFPTLRAYLEEAVPRSVARAGHIIAVSESTRRDLMFRLGVEPDRVTTVLEGVDARFSPAEDNPADIASIARLGLTSPFLLATGTLEPRKNYVRLLEAYALLRQRGYTVPLVIAGRRGWLFEPIFLRVDQLSLSEHVRFVEPNDAELVALYRRAEALIFPSLYEGFGLPPLEAMSCGTPVASSRSSSMPEVVGDAALLFDPSNVQEMSAAMEHVLSDEGLRARLKLAGPERARSFTWERAARETVDLIAVWPTVPEIAIAGLPLDYPHSGTAVYLRNLVSHLPTAAPDLDFRLSVRWARDRLASVPSDRLTTPLAVLNRGQGPGARLDKLLWEMGAWPVAAAMRGAKVLHSPYLAAPLAASAPVVVTVHDVIPLVLPGYHRSRQSAVYSRFMAWTARRAAAIITVSEHTKREIVRLFAVPEARVTVTLEAADTDFTPEMSVWTSLGYSTRIAFQSVLSYTPEAPRSGRTWRRWSGPGAQPESRCAASSSSWSSSRTFHHPIRSILTFRPWSPTWAYWMMSC